MDTSLLEIGNRYVSDDYARCAHVIFLAPDGRVVIEFYRSPCEIPDDRIVHTFATPQLANRALDGLVLQDREADLDHIFSLLSCEISNARPPLCPPPSHLSGTERRDVAREDLHDDRG